jgi:Domain of unknown function (DUF4157)
MDKDISKKSANDKGSERANGRSPGGEYQPLPFGPETEMLALHSAIGNQGIGRLLQPDGGKPGMIQAKLTVSQPGDKYEQEADHVADQVMRIPDGEVSKAISTVTSVQTRTVQRDASSGQLSAVTPDVQSKIENLRRSGGEPIPNMIREFMQPRLAVDMSQVRIHKSESAADLANKLRAKAFTVGNHIVFGRGQYKPEIDSGMGLIAHELTHTIQQSNSAPIVQRVPQPGQVKLITELNSEPVPEEVDGQAPLKSDRLEDAPPELVNQIRDLDGDFTLFLQEQLIPELEESLVGQVESKLLAARSVKRWREHEKWIVKNRLFNAHTLSRWLTLLIAAIRFVRSALAEIASNSEVDKLVAQPLIERNFQFFIRAQNLRKEPFFRLGQIQEKQKIEEMNIRFRDLGLGQGEIALTQANPFDLLKIRNSAVRELENDPDPDTQEYLQNEINILDKEIKSANAAEERGSPEPSLSEQADDLVKQADENWAQLANKLVDRYTGNERSLFIAELVFERIPKDDKAEFSRAFYGAITRRDDAEQKFLFLRRKRSGQVILAAMAISVDLDFDFFNFRSALGLDVSKGLANREISEKASSLLSEVTPQKAPALSLTLPETADLSFDINLDIVLGPRLGLGTREVTLITGSTAIHVDEPTEGFIPVTVAPSDLKAVGVRSPVTLLKPTDKVRIFLPKQRCQVVIQASQLGKFVKGEQVKALISAAEVASLAGADPLAPAFKAVVPAVIKVATPATRKVIEAMASKAGRLSERLVTKTAPKAGRIPIEAAERVGVREASTSARKGGGLAPKEVGRPRVITSADAGPESVSIQSPPGIQPRGPKGRFAETTSNVPQEASGSTVSDAGESIAGKGAKKQALKEVSERGFAGEKARAEKEGWTLMHMKNYPAIDGARKAEGGVGPVWQHKSLGPKDTGTHMDVELIEERIRQEFENVIRINESFKWTQNTRMWNKTLREKYADLFGYEMPKNWRDPPIAFHLDIEIRVPSPLGWETAAKRLERLFREKFPPNAKLTIYFSGG